MLRSLVWGDGRHGGSDRGPRCPVAGEVRAARSVVPDVGQLAGGSDRARGIDRSTRPGIQTNRRYPCPRHIPGGGTLCGADFASCGLALLAVRSESFLALVFLRPRPEARTHHLYLVEQDDPHIQELRVFRDLLRSQPELRQRYELLKHLSRRRTEIIARRTPRRSGNSWRQRCVGPGLSHSQDLRPTMPKIAAKRPRAGRYVGS